VDLKRERDKALKAARVFAGAGNVVWAQLWLDRAGQFWPVTDRQLREVQKRIPAQRKGA
jgi:hypothetical protein